MSTRKDLASFKRAVLAVPAFAMQARTNANVAWIQSAIERGDTTILPLIRAYAKLRLHGHHAQVAYVHVFCQGSKVEDVLNRSDVGSKYLEEQAIYRFEYNQLAANITVGEVWNADIARRELLTLAERAAKNDKHKIASEALKLRAAIRFN